MNLAILLFARKFFKTCYPCHSLERWLSLLLSFMKITQKSSGFDTSKCPEALFVAEIQPEKILCINSIWVPRVTTARNSQRITALASCWKTMMSMFLIICPHWNHYTTNCLKKENKAAVIALFLLSHQLPSKLWCTYTRVRISQITHTGERKGEGHRTDWMRHVWVPASSTNPSSFQPAACPQLHLHLLPLLCLLLCPRSAPNPHWDDPEEPAHRLLGGNQPTCQRTHSPQSWGCQVRLVPTLLLVLCCILKPSSKNHPESLYWQVGGWNHMNIIIVIINPPPLQEEKNQRFCNVSFFQPWNTNADRAVAMREKPSCPSCSSSLPPHILLNTWEKQVGLALVPEKTGRLILNTRKKQVGILLSTRKKQVG